MHVVEVCVLQQFQSETLRVVGCQNVQEHLESNEKFSAGQGLKVVGNVCLVCVLALSI